MHALCIGRLFGIEIRVDRSWLLIFVLLTWNLSAVFAAWHPAWPPVEPIGVVLIASLLLFACIVVHELAHSLVARRNELPVRSITWFSSAAFRTSSTDRPRHGSSF